MNNNYSINTHENGDYINTGIIKKKEAVIKLDLPAGTTNIIAIYLGNTTHATSNSTKELNILHQADIQVEILNNTETNVTAKITIKNEENTPITDELEIILPNESTIYDHADNTGNLEIKDTTVTSGQKTLTITLADTTDTKGTTITVPITVLPDYMKIIEQMNETINNLNDTVNDLNNTVNNLNNTVNEQNQTINNMNDTIKDLEEKIDKYLAPKSTIIIFDEIKDVKYNTEVTIRGTLITEDGVGLYNQNITLIIGETEVNVTTKGEFEYTTLFKELGEKTVTAKYAGFDKYLASEATISFNVVKQDITISLDPILDTVYKENVTISGKVTDVNGKGLNNINAIIKINGKLFKAKTNKTGAFSFTKVATPAGINNVTVSYAGNGNYNGYATNTTFNVKKQDIIITLDPIEDIKYKENVTIMGKITDIHGGGLFNISAVIRINGRAYKASTDKLGRFMITETMRQLGTNNVTVSYGGNDNYNSYTFNTTFNVEKQDIIITYAPIQDTIYKDNVTITGNITDIHGNALYNINALIRINGKLYKAKTDSTGSYILTTPTTTLGTNNVTLSYDGNSNYNSYVTNTTFNVIEKVE